MKILITGIGNIGKSSLRELVAHKFDGQVIQIDMDYYAHEDIPQSSEKIVLVEDVHGLERNPEQYDKIIYLMPPPNHIMLWLRRALAWFASGIVDLSDPKGVAKKYKGGRKGGRP
jgi:chloramphenicol 3-O-phosphotransferase